MDTSTAFYDTIDFDDLGFDLEPHREGLNAFARLNLEPRSIKPALRARNLVLIRIPSCRFRIGITRGDPAAQEETERHSGSTHFAILHQTSSADEAAVIRTEIERYFLRHFPGRTLLAAPTTVEEEAEAQSIGDDFSVYAACYPPADTGD